MESIFYRYRNITVLLVAVLAQIVLLAWQVKSDNDVPLVRVWAVTAVTPVAGAIESVRNGTTGFFSTYFALKNAREQSRMLRGEVDRLRLENQFLKNELTSAQRAETLAGFQVHTPSKMIGARVIGTTTGVGGKSVLIDRGTSSGVRKGMAVVTPDGIVGRVVAVYPFASQVLSVSDPGFAAGVESQKNHIHGVLKGLGNGSTRVDYVPTGQKVEVGELFFTSGEDRIFPKGLPVGKVISVKEGSNFQDIFLQPSGVETAPEEVLVIVNPVHQEIPETPPADSPVFLAPDVKPDSEASAQTGISQAGQKGTQADKMMDEYKKIGDAQKHTFGEGLPGTLPPNFNLKVPGVNAPAAATGNAPAVSKPPAKGMATSPGVTPAGGAPIGPRPPVAGSQPVTRPSGTATSPPAGSPVQRPAAQKPPLSATPAAPPSSTPVP
ncbi:MAG: rod shape-determining protein MreC [Terriglobia bacterium]